MSKVTFVPNSDHCPQRTVYYFVNSNFKDFDLCRADLIYSRLKNFYTNADTRINELNELRLIIEASCYDVFVRKEVLPKNSRFRVSKLVFIFMVASCFGILISMMLLEAL